MTTPPLVVPTGEPAGEPPAPGWCPAPRPVPLRGVVLGGTRLPVVAGVATGADVFHFSLRDRHGDPRAGEELAAARDLSAAPLLVEPFSAADLPLVARYADGVLVGGDWMQDFRLLAAVGGLGLPVLLQRGHYATVAEWLASVEYLVAGGAEHVALCETGSRTHLARPAVDLGLVAEARERSGRPVLVDVTETPRLAAAAVAAGADGVFLGTRAPEQAVSAAVAAATALTPLVRPVAPAGLAECREAIDRVDATLAVLLDYRATLAGAVQRHKPVGGQAGRDPAREREIVRRMAQRAPHLGARRIAAIMAAVIDAGLDAAAEPIEPAGPPRRGGAAAVGPGN